MMRAFWLRREKRIALLAGLLPRLAAVRSQLCRRVCSAGQFAAKRDSGRVNERCFRGGAWHWCSRRVPTLAMVLL